MAGKSHAIHQTKLAYLKAAIIFSTIFAAAIITNVKAGDIFEGVPIHLVSLFAKYHVMPSDEVVVRLMDGDYSSGQVPIEVVTAIKGAKSIVLIVPGNDKPLAAVFKLTNNKIQSVQTRLRLKESSDILAFVQTDEQLFGNSTYVDLR